MKLKWLWLLFIPLWIHAEVSWEGAEGAYSAQVKFTKSSLELKDDLNIDLILTYPEGTHINLNRIRTNLLRHSGYGEFPFKIVAESTEQPIKGPNGKITQVFHWNLIPHLTGKFDLSFFDIPFDSGKETISLYTKIFQLEVSNKNTDSDSLMEAPLLNFSSTLPVDLSSENRRFILDNPNTERREIARNERIFERKTFPWIPLIAFALIGLFIASTRIKQTKPETAAEKAKKLETVKSRTIQGLEILGKENLPSKNKMDEFYVRLTGLVRGYIEGYYRVNAPQQTTEEFLHSITKNPVFTDSDKTRLNKFLSFSDRVKFARYAPSPAESQEALKSAQEFVLKG